MPRFDLIQGGLANRKPDAYKLFTFDDRVVIRLERQDGRPADLLLSRQEAIEFTAKLLLQFGAIKPRKAAGP